MRNKALFFVSALGVIFFILKFDISVLNFTHTQWLFFLSFDTGTELISWNYFRHSPWAFPVIGQMEGYDYPTVTGSGMTGIVSPLAIPIKLISNYLPAQFQYFGWWFLLCFILQARFGYKLINNLAARYNLPESNQNGITWQLQTTLATIFFIIAPPFLARTGHIHLFAHFFILAALAYYFDNKTSKQKFISYAILTALAAGVSQYTTVMVMGIGLASFTEQWHRKRIGFFAVLGAGLGFVAVALSVFYILGNFLMNFNAVQSGGFGEYSSNLNTFFNPMEHSKILSALPISNRGQYEGFGYLGAGFLLLLSISIVGLIIKSFIKTNNNSLIKKENIAGLYPLMFMTTLFFIYALSQKIGLNGTLVHEWRYGELGNIIFSSLRGSGRFIWVPFYVIMAFGLVAFFRLKFNFTFSIGLLVLFISAQIFDIQSLMKMNKDVFDLKKAVQSKHHAWKPIMAEADRVVMLPMYHWNYNEGNDFYPFAQAASEMKKGITTGYFARRDMLMLRKYEVNAYAQWEKGDLGENSNAVFIGVKNKIWRLDTFVKQGKLLPFQYDNYAILIPSTLTKTIAYLNNLPNCRPMPFNTEGVADFIQKHADKTIFITAKEEATGNLDATTKEKFIQMGSTELPKLGFAGAYVAIIHKGKVVFEIVDNQQIIEKKWLKGAELNKGIMAPKDISLTSGGAYMSSLSNTVIDGKDYSPSKRGLNFVVVNDAFEVIEITNFDTYEDNKRAVIK